MRRRSVVTGVTAACALAASLLTASLGPVASAAPGDPPRIAFTDERDEIQAVNLTQTDGGNLQVGPRFTPESPQGAALGPEHLGEASYGTRGVTFVQTSDDDPAGDVWIDNLDGGLDPLTCDNTAHETHPVQSIDGLVAYASDIGGDWDVYVATDDPTPFPGFGDVGGVCDGWSALRVTDDPAPPTDQPDLRYDDRWPAWTPDGNALVWSSTRSDPLGDLWTATIDDGEVLDVTQVTDTPGVAESQPAAARLYENGDDDRLQTWVAFTTTQYRPDGSLAFLRLDFGVDPVVTPAYGEGNGMQQSEAAWSGDPRRPYLSFTSTAGDPWGGIWIDTVNSPTSEQVTESGTVPARPPTMESTDLDVVADLPGVVESHATWTETFQPPDTSGGDSFAQLWLTSTAVPTEELNRLQHVADADLGDVLADGTNRRLLVHETRGAPVNYRVDERGPDYSPDGTKIVYSADQPPSSDDPGRQLWLANADGSNPTPLVYDFGNDDIDIDPAWSPDGKHVAFTRFESDGDGGHGRAELVVVDLDASLQQTAQRVLTEVPSGLRGVQDESPSWSPDSKLLVFARTSLFPIGLVAGRPDSSPFAMLWVVAADGTGGTGDPLKRDSGILSCGPPTCQPIQSVPGQQPAWSPDGSTIVYVEHQALRTIRVNRDPSGAVVGLVTQGPNVTGFTGRNQNGDPTPSRATISAAADPAWRRDGTEIAFTGSEAGQPDLRGIYSIKPDGTGLRLVTDDRGPESEPTWGPQEEKPPVVEPKTVDVSVTVAIAGSPARPGDPITATYTVTNNGTGDAAAVTLATSATPGGTQSAAVPPPGCNADGSGCVFGTLAPGATRQYVVTLTYPSARDGSVTGTVSTASPDTNPANNTASAPFRVVSVDVSVKLTLDGPTGWVGGKRVLRVDVRNTGPEPAEDVTLSLDHPDALVTPQAVAPNDCLNTASPPCSLGTLAVGELRSLEVPLTMKHEGNATLRATVTTSSADSNPANDEATAKLKVLQPVVQLLPAVARPGMVTMAYGEKMPPGTRVRLTWVPGITINTGPFKVDRDGTMRAPLLLVRHDLLGNREIEATSVSGDFSAVRGPMLVVERLSTAPDFLARG